MSSAHAVMRHRTLHLHIPRIATLCSRLVRWLFRRSVMESESRLRHIVGILISLCKRNYIYSNMVTYLVSFNRVSRLAHSHFLPSAARTQLTYTCTKEEAFYSVYWTTLNDFEIMKSSLIYDNYKPIYVVAKSCCWATRNVLSHNRLERLIKDDNACKWSKIHVKSSGKIGKYASVSEKPRVLHLMIFMWR